jgi:uncharacterized protein YecT (DUF1311 family)
MIALLLAALIGAQDGLPPECGKTDTTLEINDCFAALGGLETDRMERYYAAAVERITEEEDPEVRAVVLEGLAASQQTWLTYAREACDVVYTRWQRGTIRTFYAIEGGRELTRERAHHLWREYLTYPDSTPALLPEPTAFVADPPRS